MSDSADALLRRQILPSSWYPYDDSLELMEAIRVNVLEGSLDAVSDLAASGAPIVYGGAHRALVSEGDPVKTIETIGSLWGACHDFGRATAQVGESEASIRIADALPMGELEGHINLGWIRGILEVAGAHALQAGFGERPWLGAKELLLHYRWA
jgi:hypothetical protein